MMRLVGRGRGVGGIDMFLLFLSNSDPSPNSSSRWRRATAGVNTLMATLGRRARHSRLGGWIFGWHVMRGAGMEKKMW